MALPSTPPISTTIPTRVPRPRPALVGGQPGSEPVPPHPKPPPVWLPASAAANTSPPSTPDSDDSDHYDDAPAVRAAPRTPRVLQPATALRAQMNMRAISLAANNPPPSLPPLLQLPGAPLFPRSVNAPHTLESVPSTRTTMLRTALLRRLEAHVLSPSELESISQLGHRPKTTVPKSRRRTVDDEALSDVKKVALYSRGAEEWINRPCFEERLLLWSWDSDRQTLVSRPIPGSHRAVASLEFSEYIEALAGYPVEPTLTGDPPALSPLDVPATTSAASSTTAASTGPPTPATGPSTPASAPTTPIATTAAPAPPPVPAILTPRKPKMLRFLPDPDNSDDNVPLGVQVLTKRGHPRPAEERTRIAREEAQKRRLLAEEEEERKRMYAAEVAAARARREGSRGGSTSHDAVLERGRDHRQSFTRPAYDPSRRGVSDTEYARPPADTPQGTRSRPASIRSERMTHVSTTTRRTPPPPSPPAHVRSQTMPSNEMQDAKLRRRMSNVSDGATSAVGTARSGSRTLPRSFSAGAGSPMRMSPMLMPVPPLPVMGMPVYVMPAPGVGVPQFYMPQPMPMLAPLPPARAPAAVRHHTEGAAPGASPGASGTHRVRRPTSGMEGARRASRMSTSTLAPPNSHNRQGPPPSPGHGRGAKPPMPSGSRTR